MELRSKNLPRPYICGTFLHIPHVGEKRCRRLSEAGIDCWQKVPEQCPEALPEFQASWEEFRRQVKLGENMLQKNQWDFFLDRLPYSERWRILADCWNQVVYLDIETSAVDFSSTVTTVSCWDGRELHLFFQGENLEDFLDYADSVKVFATFNGASFDLPQLGRYFHVPELFSGIHLDLRWMFRSRGWCGGLKSIEKERGIVRPRDIIETRGDEAIMLWDEWQVTGNQDARRKLLRYCAADTITLRMLAVQFLAEQGCDMREFPLDMAQDWENLDRMYPPVYEKTVPERKNSGLVIPPPGKMLLHSPADKEADPEYVKMQSRLKRFLQRKREE